MSSNYRCRREICSRLQGFHLIWMHTYRLILPLSMRVVFLSHNLICTSNDEQEHCEKSDIQIYDLDVLLIKLVILKSFLFYDLYLKLTLFRLSQKGVFQYSSWLRQEHPHLTPIQTCTTCFITGMFFFLYFCI